MEPIKDEDRAHPIADAWRPVLREIVRALVEGDYALSRTVPSVAPVAKKTAEQTRAYVADYGEELVELPDDTWTTSVCQWMGTRWDVLLDLWTRDSGASDLVLGLRVFEADAGFRFEVQLLYVP